MKTIAVQSIKLSLPFKAGALPRIDPAAPVFELALGGVKIQASVNAKAARKLATWEGSAVLQGKLIVEDGRLVLIEGGFLFNDPKPVGVGP